MKITLLSLLFFCIALVSVSGQSENVTIIKDSRLDFVIEKHKEFNKIQNSIPGYRIQIFSGSGNFSKTNATTAQQKFTSKYPEIKTYIIFITPYYFIRVGNFRTRLDAEAYRQKITEAYPEAYIVKDDIELP